MGQASNELGVFINSVASGLEKGCTQEHEM